MSDVANTDLGGFRAIGLTPEPVVERTRRPPRLLRFASADGFELRVPADLVERIARFGRAAAPREWFGLLVGIVARDERGTYVELVGVVPDEEASTTHTSVATSAASEAKTRAMARTLFPDALIVGPVHTHPRLTAFYSEVDRANQRTWKKPHAVGIVLDPWGDPLLRAYRGPECEELAPVALSRRVHDRTTTAAAPPPPDGAQHRGRHVLDRLVVAVPTLGLAAYLFFSFGSLGPRVAQTETRLARLEARAHRTPPPPPSRPRPASTLAAEVPVEADRAMCVVDRPSEQDAEPAQSHKPEVP